MKFGINLFPTVGPGDKSGVRFFEEALALAERAEQLGYHHVKTVEHYFSAYGGYSPDPVTFLAAAAARTERVRLITGAVLPAFSHPVKLAGKLAMLDHLSHGRLDVGFGRGFLPEEFWAYQVPMDESRARFNEGVEACLRLWTEEEVTYEGNFHTFGPVTLLPRPFQSPHPRVLVATAITPESGEAAGAAGYGVMMVPSINKQEKLQEMLARYRDTRTTAGLTTTDEDVHFSYNCYLAEDRDKAHRLGQVYSERTNSLLASAVSSWQHNRSSDYAGYERIVARVNSSDFNKQLRDNKVLVGDPQEVADRVELIRSLYGETTISLQIVSGNMPFEESVRTLELFAEHILPRFS
ncbi:LLM class flavin-dependent oxidoreductase [Streptomyces sp. NPDC057424]|uniref:LLM class flavin-dependent oxidoreductase n=1 Tax=Streptomyces sp. NPDC057424 TaxID=3346127 RepID=UPI0036BA50F2